MAIQVPGMICRYICDSFVGKVVAITIVCLEKALRSVRIRFGAREE